VSTARDLLEQADALMRGNRLREAAAAAAATDIPVLTEVVAAGDADTARVPAAEALREAEASDFAPMPRAGAGAAPAAAREFPVLTEVVEAPEPIPIAGEQVAAAPAAPSGGVDPDAARWSALAEEVRMQVLQRIDIFTDTGLQEQLTARVQPIVDRASADLVATINRQMGQLLRAYVAEAIEREIEKWRHDGAA